MPFWVNSLHNNSPQSTSSSAQRGDQRRGRYRANALFRTRLAKLPVATHCRWSSEGVWRFRRNYLLLAVLCIPAREPVGTRACLRPWKPSSSRPATPGPGWRHTPSTQGISRVTTPTPFWWSTMVVSSTCCSPTCLQVRCAIDTASVYALHFHKLSMEISQFHF